ncbi:hypothetical protein [Ktedonospora formicarum]|uniref:Transposase n=1 Tax=Ktedonospora formicarum TaxID=2778364 RepID=A0A8J3I7E6_9CHLR|nr:hypothetical protein [Ktedonospora formicarum]GHO48826.1 hypothetical protein KSX_69890 [Ktedonospora formicarum]
MDPSIFSDSLPHFTKHCLIVLSAGSEKLLCHAFEEKGLACLKQESSRPKTVQAQFDQAKCEALRALLHQNPRTFGKTTSCWTLALAVEVCFERELTESQVSIETIRLALKRLGVGWQRAKHWITSVRRVGAYEISV